MQGRYIEGVKVYTDFCSLNILLKKDSINVKKSKFALPIYIPLLSLPVPR